MEPIIEFKQVVKEFEGQVVLKELISPFIKEKSLS